MNKLLFFLPLQNHAAQSRQQNKAAVADREGFVGKVVGKQQTTVCNLVGRVAVLPIGEIEQQNQFRARAVPPRQRKDFRLGLPRLP